MPSGLAQLIRADIARYAGSSPRPLSRTLRIVMESYGLQATMVYRLGTWLRRTMRAPLGIATLPLWLIYAIASGAMNKCYGIRLALSAQIGPGLYIGHFGGIVLENCYLGSECSIAQQTTIQGQNIESGPRIGSRVWIGAHTKIIGPIVVGDGATIGAGSKVLADVPAGALAMGSPARCVHASYDNRAFLFPLGQ